VPPTHQNGDRSKRRDQNGDKKPSQNGERSLKRLSSVCPTYEFLGDIASGN